MTVETKQRQEGIRRFFLDPARDFMAAFQRVLPQNPWAALALLFLGFLISWWIYVPLQAVFREGSDAFVYVPDGGGYAQRRVALGKASGLHVEITTGVDSGETVLLREPEVREIVARLEEQPPLKGQAVMGRPKGQRRRGGPPRG